MTKVLAKQKLVEREQCQGKRSHSALISAPWSTHEVFKAHWQRVPPILRCSDLAAASPSLFPLMTDPQEDTAQDVLKNLPFQHLMNIWPYTAPVFNSVHTEHQQQRTRLKTATFSWKDHWWRWLGQLWSGLINASLSISPPLHSWFC